MKTKLIYIILIIAAVLRMWNLGGVPPGLTSDEAALGYNAYSILQTGRDEHGELFPIILKSFGDYKPGLYVYTAIPFIAVLGLTEVAVRLPSALLGVLSVYLIYLVVGLLETKKENLKLAAAALLAISPWSIHFSRGAWEINLSLALTLLGILFFLKSLQSRKYLYLSAVSFAATLLAYQGAKLSTAIVVLILAFVYRKEVFKFDRKILAKSAALGLLIAAPILLSLFQGKTGRLTVFSVLSYPRPEEYLDEFLDKADEQKYDLSYYIFHPESLNFTRGILGRWFNHYSSRFLFFEGDWQNARHSAPNSGVLLVGDIVLLLVGVVHLIKSGNKKYVLFAFAWLLTSTIPSAMSRDQVHAVRSFSMVIPVILISSVGLTSLLKYKKIALLVLAAYVLSFVYYLDSYFIHLSRHDSKLWHYGYKEIVETVNEVKDNYITVKVQQSFAQPYIYFLFYGKYDPALYQRENKFRASEFGDVGRVDQLGNICFCALDWTVNMGEKGNLFVADTLRIPPLDSNDPRRFELIREINYLDGETAFRIVAVKQ